MLIRSGRACRDPGLTWHLMIRDVGFMEMKSIPERVFGDGLFFVLEWVSGTRRRGGIGMESIFHHSDSTAFEN